LKLTLDDIVKAAQDLIDAEGLSGLNMRAVASRLDAQASALYWHIKNRAELLTLISDGYYQRAFAAVPDGLDWPDWLRAYGHAFHAELLSHRDSAQICGLARPSARHVGNGLDVLVAPLVARGLTRAQALTCQSSVISLAMGWAMFEESAHMRTHLERVMDLQQSFSLGLEAMVAGMAAQLRAKPG
jgi:TetR/AcrR family transcriptional regulator, tetracycline repressor protein